MAPSLVKAYIWHVGYHYEKFWVIWGKIRNLFFCSIYVSNVVFFINWFFVKFWLLCRKCGHWWKLTEQFVLDFRIFFKSIFVSFLYGKFSLFKVLFLTSQCLSICIFLCIDVCVSMSLYECCPLCQSGAVLWTVLSMYPYFSLPERFGSLQFLPFPV